MTAAVLDAPARVRPAGAAPARHAEAIRILSAVPRVSGAYGCPGCSCAPVDCENGTCCCACCCYVNYPLPAVAGLPVLEVVW